MLRPPLPPQPNQLAGNPLLNLHTQNLLLQNQLNPQSNLHPWPMLRFSQPGIPGAPGITTGIPPQQNLAADLASQEIAKLYRMKFVLTLCTGSSFPYFSQLKQEQAVPRPPSQQVERAASVAAGLPNANLPPSSAAAFSTLLQNQNVNALLGGHGVPQSSAAQQLNPGFMNNQQNTDTVMRILQMQMHQHQQQQQQQQHHQQQQQQAMHAFVQAEVQKLAEQQAQAQAQARVQAQAHVEAQARAQQQAAAAARLQTPVFQNGLLNQFPNLLGSSASAAMGMNPNSVRHNMFNLFMVACDKSIIQ